MLAHCAILFALSVSANADSINVTYEIGPYSTGNYSASSLHTSSWCPGAGPDSGDTLYMCGYLMSPITGSVTGISDGGVLSINGGYLNIFGHNYNIGSSSLGGDFTNSAGDPLWFLEIDWFGTFYFESIAMGTGGPNYFGPDSFVLWGQNDDAYDCDDLPIATDKNLACAPWGIDLYGKRVPVPEPGTLALLGPGLGFLAWRRRNPRA